MILNVWSVTALFLAGASALLALGALAASVRTAVELRRSPASSEPVARLARLLLLFVVVLGAARLLAWPHLYLLLASYVPELAPFGVMCAFGVTRANPVQVGLLQILDPLLLWGVGLWCLLAAADRASQGATARLGPRLALAAVLAALALAVSGLEGHYVLSDKLGASVTCCTSSGSLAASTRPDQIAPLQRHGLARLLDGESALALFFLANGILIAFVFLARPQRWKSRRRRVLAWSGVAAFAGANLLVTHAAWLQALAPRLSGLPYHHCVYELVTGSPDLALAAGCAILANACLSWPLLLELWRKPERPGQVAMAALQGSVFEACGVALASELLIVAVRWP